jgi:bacterial/archaeal transporter family protein
MWLLFSLLAAIFWASGGTLVKKGLYHISPLIGNIIGFFTFLIIFIPYAFLNGATFEIDLLSFILLIIITIFINVYFYGLEKGQMALSGTIIATYPVITILLSTLFIGETLTFIQISMIFLIIIGGAILSYTDTNSQTFKPYWFIWAVATSISLGIADFLAKVVITRIGLNHYLLFFPFAFLIALCFFWIIDKKGRKFPKVKKVKNLLFMFLGNAVENLGNLFFYASLSLGLASLVSPISSSWAAMAVIMALVFLKEKISRQQLLGIIIIVIGIIFTCI